MAKTYVVKLEIDGVSESITSINQLEDAVSNLENELKSADLGSEEFKKLSKELGAAKKELNVFQRDIDALDPTAKAEQFVKFGEGIAGGFAIASGAASLLGVESEALEKTMVQTQSAIAIAVGFRSLAESKLTQALGQSVIAEKARAAATGVSAFVTGAATKGVKAFRLALASTGIGAIVVAVGLLVAYWDDIKALVSGVTSEQKKLNKEAEENVELAKENLKAIEEQENIIRLQGKSETEIRDLKIAQTNEIILATQLQLEQMEATKQAQIDAAQRNKDIAQGIINFLNIPIVKLLKAVDTLTFGLSKIGLLDEATTFAEDFGGGLAGLLFDPEETAQKGEEELEALKKSLLDLENARAGFILQNKAQDKAIADEKEAQKIKDQEEADAELDRILEREANEWQQLQDLKNELAILALESDFERQQEALKQQEIADLNAINGAENFFEQKALIEQKYIKLNADLVNDNAKKQRELDEANQKEAAEFKEKQLKKGIADAQNILSLGGEKLQKVGKALAIADITRDSVKAISTTVSATTEANAKSVAASQIGRASCRERV